MHTPAKHRALAAAIRRNRIEKGLTEADVAQRMRVTVATLVRMEGGRRRIDIIEYCRLAEAVGFDAVKLMEQIFERRNRKRK